MTIIDTHVHIWQPHSSVYPWDRAVRNPPSFSNPLENLLRAMSIANIDKAILVQHSIYGYDNRYILNCARDYPDVFGTIIKLNPLAADSPQQLRQLVEVHNIQGLRLHVSNQADPSWLAAPETYALWEMAARLGIVIGILLDPPQMPYAHNIISHFPEVLVIIDHLGRVNVDMPVRSKHFQQLLDLAKYPHVFVKVSGFYALSKQTFPYADLMPHVQSIWQRFGSQRLMWATDFPLLLQKGESYAQAVTVLSQLLPQLMETDREWLLGKTALSLFQFHTAR